MSTPFRHPQHATPRGGNDFAKAPKPPDRPLVPYMRYSRKNWAKVRADNPDAQLWDIGKIIGQMWREAPDSDKTVFQQEYEVEKVEYDKAMKNYQNSHAYQQYNAKNRAKANEKASRARVEAGGVVIQPVDEDEMNNELTSRRLAAVRWERNHRLIADIFSANVVTDPRTICTQSRIDMLRNQAKSLASHQTRLEDELTKLTNEHKDKKRLIEKNSDDFVENLKKVCEEKPKCDEERFQKFVDEWTGKLADAYEDYKKKQEEINQKLAAEREKMEKETPVLAELVMGDDEAEKKTEDKETEEKEPEKAEEKTGEEEKAEEKEKEEEKKE